jgi:hypothetical protein
MLFYHVFGMDMVLPDKKRGGGGYFLVVQFPGYCAAAVFVC